MDEYGLDWYTCEKCGDAFDEFEMNYKVTQQDKKILCRKCRAKLETDQPEVRGGDTQ